ncbi:alpha/beta fold hydrolase [Streptomyces sp. NPDC059991]|uniref:alpha/beta fold hydrolase n=1 Tax=Streptomyces sp. NPDC059991 TaxID=3347028 RepID=UPI00367A9854
MPGTRSGSVTPSAPTATSPAKPTRLIRLRTGGRCGRAWPGDRHLVVLRSGDRHPGWLPGVDRPGRAPPWGSRFRRLSCRDTVAADVLLANALGIHRWAAVIGCSMGGCRALEWPITHPDRVASLLAIGCTASHDGGDDRAGLQPDQGHHRRPRLARRGLLPAELMHGGTTHVGCDALG